jgi:hypothetical protein
MIDPSTSSIYDNIFLSTMCLLQCLRKRQQKTFKKYELLPKGHPDMTAGNKSVISIHRLEANSLKNVLGSIIWSMRNISCIYYNFIIYYIVISDFWPRYYWNIVESGVKHHNWNPLIFGTLLYWFYVFLWFFLLVFELFRQCGIFSINGYYGYLQVKKKGGGTERIFCNENKLSSSIYDNIFLSTMCLLQCLRKRTIIETLWFSVLCCIDFTSFYDFSFWFLNCSDSVEFSFYSLTISLKSMNW